MSIECNFKELISCDQWELVQSMCHVLRPFDAASREMSAHMSTLSHVIPMIHILSRRVEMLFVETMGIDTMLKSLKEAWRDTYLLLSTTPDTSLLHCWTLATKLPCSQRKRRSSTDKT
ncbi:hypothetical protein STEG23_016929 [Scotinomys teguina]